MVFVFCLIKMLTVFQKTTYYMIAFYAVYCTHYMP